MLTVREIQIFFVQASSKAGYFMYSEENIEVFWDLDLKRPF